MKYIRPILIFAALALILWLGWQLSLAGATVLGVILVAIGSTAVINLTTT